MRTHHQAQLVVFAVLATFQCINRYDQKCNKYVIIAVINKSIVVVIDIFGIKIGGNYGEIIV